MELQMAQEHNIPVIGMCKSNVKPSIMATGIPATKNVIYYKDQKHLLSELQKYLDRRFGV